MDDRYQLLGKEVKYISSYISQWEVFDFNYFMQLLNEMRELQIKMKLNYDPHEGEA